MGEKHAGDLLQYSTWSGRFRTTRCGVSKARPQIRSLIITGLEFVDSLMWEFDYDTCAEQSMLYRGDNRGHVINIWRYYSPRKS